MKGRQTAGCREAQSSCHCKNTPANVGLEGEGGFAMPELWTTGWRGETQDLNMEQIPAGQLQRMKEALIERCLKDKTATVFCLGENLPFFRKDYVLLSGPNVWFHSFRQEKLILSHINQLPYSSDSDILTNMC